jgi:hypothetical protein
MLLNNQSWYFWKWPGDYEIKDIRMYQKISTKDMDEALKELDE